MGTRLQDKLMKEARFASALLALSVQLQPLAIHTSIGGGSILQPPQCLKAFMHWVRQVRQTFAVFQVLIPLNLEKKRYLLETLSQLFLIKMKLPVVTVALLLCAVLATTVTAFIRDEERKNFSCFYNHAMYLLCPCM